MRAVSNRNFSRAKYGKFIWPQAKRSWSFRRATKKKERCCADLCCDWDTFGECPQSFTAGTFGEACKWLRTFTKACKWLRHSRMLLQALDGTAMWCFFLTLWWAFFAQFFLGLSQVTCWSLIFLYFFYFVWVLTIFLDPYNHDSLLSSQSIRRRRSSSDLNSQPVASQPYPLATRVLECPQSFTSFLVIHFHFAYFPVCLFR